MSKSLKNTFLIHAVVAGIVGALMLVVPGSFLEGIGWQQMLEDYGWGREGWLNIDPFESRMLGAAMLALAWSSYYGWRATDWEQVAVLVQMEAVFCVLSCVGFLRHLLGMAINDDFYPTIAWIVLAGFAVFAIAWGYFLVRKEARRPALT